MGGPRTKSATAVQARCTIFLVFSMRKTEGTWRDVGIKVWRRFFKAWRRYDSHSLARVRSFGLAVI
jgi:hypothetical protein